ncbi:MAG: hypothetical protein RIC19_15200 [Phaeodactylibacter sp.]|uniref:hypothetical protein n=1 Tax=Phaeodactylibacter sp. TaxID=1940289 RepID=UPI0032EB1ED3
MARLTLFFALLLALPLALRAQLTTYYPAKIWLKNGERLTGEIEKPDWQKGTERLLYRSKSDPEPQFLNTPEIDKIILTEDQLERRYLSRSVQRLYLPDTMPVGDTLLYVQDTLLLQAVVEGTLGFYYHETPGGRANYFLEKGGVFTQLVQHSYHRVGSGRRIRFRHDQWQEQLLTVMSDCRATKDRIPKIQFTDEGIKRLFVQYNECGSRKRLDYELEFKKWTLRPGVQAGAAFTRVSTRDRIFRDAGTGSFAPRIGASLLLLPFQGDGRSGFLAEVLYAPFRTTDDFDNFEVDADYLQLNLGVRNSGIATVFGSIFAGFSIARQIGDPIRTNLTDRVIQPTQLGLFGGFSISGEHVEVSLCYEIDDIGLLSPNAPFFYTNSLSLMAGYRF